tara:strand:+ start:498 stop:761 length:264 start_codon:yes stop_codon:yes gene_type:complete
MLYLKNVSLLLPILVALLFITSPEKIETFTLTMLGKLLAISLVLYYTTINMLLGFVILLIVIYYYSHYDYDFLLNMDEKDLWEIILN